MWNAFQTMCVWRFSFQTLFSFLCTSGWPKGRPGRRRRGALVLVLVQGAGAGLWQFELWNLRVGFAPGRCGVPLPHVCGSARFGAWVLLSCCQNHVVLCGVCVYVLLYSGGPRRSYQKEKPPYSFGPGLLVSWSPAPLVPWSPGPLVPWSSGPLVLRPALRVLASALSRPDAFKVICEILSYTL